VNAVNLTGVLARNPELRYPNGRPSAKLFVTTASPQKGADGKWSAVRTIIPVLVDESKAERIAGWLKAGMRVEITGRLKSMKIETQNGPVSVPAVVAITVNEVKK
jgi:single-stranded DNA-binding protein